MLRRMVQVVSAVLLLGYPFAVYVGLTRWDVRTAALVLLALAIPIAISRLSKERGEDLRTIALVPLITVGLLALGAILNESGFILAIPVLINVALLLTFASTLRWGPPMIERFARLVEPDLSPPKVRWCRLWTWLWCAFFVLNAGTAAVLALFGTLEAWTLYNGFIAYMLIGVMFAIEFVLRHLRFGRGAQA